MLLSTMLFTMVTVLIIITKVRILKVFIMIITAVGVLEVINIKIIIMTINMKIRLEPNIIKMRTIIDLWHLKKKKAS